MSNGDKNATVSNVLTSLSPRLPSLVYMHPETLALSNLESTFGLCPLQWLSCTPGAGIPLQTGVFLARSSIVSTVPRPAAASPQYHRHRYRARPKHPSLHPLA